FGPIFTGGYSDLYQQLSWRRKSGSLNPSQGCCTTRRSFRAPAWMQKIPANRTENTRSRSCMALTGKGGSVSERTYINGNFEVLIQLMRVSLPVSKCTCANGY